MDEQKKRLARLTKKSVKRKVKETLTPIEKLQTVTYKEIATGVDIDFELFNFQDYT